MINSENIKVYPTINYYIIDDLKKKALSENSKNLIIL